MKTEQVKQCDERHIYSKSLLVAPCIIYNQDNILKSSIRNVIQKNKVLRFYSVSVLVK